MPDEDPADRLKLASELAMRRARRILAAMKRLMEAEARILAEAEENKAKTQAVKHRSDAK